MKNLNERFQLIGKNLLQWSWTKSLLYWIILSAGTVSECAFLVASLYVSLNASVHPLIRTFIPEATTIHLGQLATAAYVGLPECILALAITTTLSHIKLWFYSRKESRTALIWSVLYGTPTIVFLILSLITIGCSMLSINFQLPPYMIVIRGLSGYFYGLIALLYWQIGKSQEVDRLRKKDDFIKELKANTGAFIDQIAEEKALLAQEMAEQKQAFERKIADLHSEIKSLSQQLLESLSQQKTLEHELNKSSEMALEAYGEECAFWLKNADKSVLIEEITRYTGHTRQKINGAIKTEALKTTPRNPGRILVPSLISWLKDTPPPERKTESVILRLVGD